MKHCLFYYKSQTQARNAAELLRNYRISATLTKPPRDQSINYCAYAVKISLYDYGMANEILENYSLPPIKIQYTDD